MAVPENLFAAVVRQGKARGKAIASAAPGARLAASEKWGLGPDNVLPLPPSGHPKAAAFAKHVVMRAPKTKPDPARGLTQRAIDKQHARARGILGLPGRQEAALRVAGKAARESVTTVLTPLREVTVHAGETAQSGPNATVVIIRAGIGNPEDKHFYTPAALQESVDNKLWEGVQCYIDHPTTVEDKIIPERRVEMLAGYFQDAKMTTDGGRPAIAATFVPEIGNGVVLDKLRTAVRYAKQFPDKSYVGWSINALGIGAPDKVNGQTVNRVDHLTKATSVDLVTKAGAGGRLLTFREAYRMSVAAAKKPFSDEQVTALGELVGNVLELKLKEAVKTAVEEAVKPLTEAEGAQHLPTCDCETKTHGDDVASCDCLKGCPAMLEEDEDGMESEESAGGTDAGGEGGESSREAERDGDRAHRRRNREAREARRTRKESKARVPASKGHASGGKMTDDDAVRSVDPAPETDEDDEDATLEVAVESLTRSQLEAYAKKNFAEARKAKKEAAKARESSRSSVRLLSHIKREAAAERVLRESGIPAAHHPRLMRELTRDAETVGEMRTIATDYKKAYVDPFAIGAGGSVLRESGVPATLKLRCFAGGK